MKLRYLPFITLVCVAYTGATQASSLDLNLSDDAVFARFATPINNTGLEADVSFLHHEEDGEPDRNIAAVGFHLVADAAQGVTPFQVGIGAKLFFLDATVVEGGALGVGGHVRYTFPSYNRFAIAGNLYYAPDITSFGDTTKYLQFGIRAEYEILRQANVYLGYRRATAEFDFTDAGTPGLPGEDDVTLTDGVFFGFSILF